ncbi:MAG: 30S ribosomal protein S17e [DPANN group archaeon]|nr:30S ribosomal protein S17e [DPANN group archaeon]
MGRIRSGRVKRQAEKLMSKYYANFRSSFAQNKLVLAQVAEIPTKKLRNLLAGYITKKIKIDIKEQ